VAHDHFHDHNHGLASLKKPFVIGIGLNIIYAVIELLGGFYYGSMSLISDAGHNFVDVFSLSLAYAGILLSGIRPNKKFTFGYRKSTVIAAVFNAVLLILSVFIIIKESISRVINPVEVDGIPMMVIASVGIIINGFTGLLFFKGQHKDLNVKAAFMHLVADALISLGVVISGIIIYFTGMTIIDPAFSIIIALVIMYMTLKILRNSIQMALDGVPDSIEMEKIESDIKLIGGIEDIHHVHIWSLSTSDHALTGHIAVNKEISIEDLEPLKESVRKVLKKHGISHSTLEFEMSGENCNNHCIG
jgi:cobalt-zinc-cadmium efflux system protein